MVDSSRCLQQLSCRVYAAHAALQLLRRMLHSCLHTLVSEVLALPIFQHRAHSECPVCKLIGLKWMHHGCVTVELNGTYNRRVRVANAVQEKTA
eukprot:scaffold93310_cov18-Tisochrysis_lutea.AAC.2